MTDCPDHARCAFFESVFASPLLRIKYATMYPYCRGGKYESCMRRWMMLEGQAVPQDLLPDGGRDWFAGAAHRPTAHVTRVLVVDDMVLFRKALIGMVQEATGHGAEIVEAESGEEALEILTQDSGDWSAVVTDYNMGGMTGYDLIMGMRALPAHGQLPAVVFSSDSESWKREQCVALPRVRWLTKHPDKQPFVDAWRELVVESKV